MANKYQIVKTFRRLFRRFQYIHPSKRHIVLITLCFWLSAITLWTIRRSPLNDNNNEFLNPNTNILDNVVLEIFSGETNPYYNEIDKWHRNDSNLPKLFPTSQTSSRWRYYPKKELFAWHEVPLHSVRALVDNNKTYSGEMGEPVDIPKNLQSEAKKLYSKHQLNIVASDLVSLNRRLPDVRHESCLIVQYPDRLPKTSVIIVFHNEAWSTLLRTVHSVINRSPPSLLKEILLIDDASSNIELGQKLDDYLIKLPVPSRVIRMPTRDGLITARLTGAQQASGSVLVFLDAHTEASPGWLPPILNEIVQDRTRVVVPVIDDVRDDTFAYDPTENDHMRGGLNWKLLHEWIYPQPWIQDQNPNDAFPVPTMIGCAFAIDREFFFASGGYDDQMKIWGGENVEMSVRIWRCGGSLLAAPCSRIGHVYRKNTPHTVPGGLRAKIDTLNTNTARFAEVWLDEYKHFYYYMNPSVSKSDFGDISGRLQLIQDLNCHSFQWFLQHVYTDSYFPDDHQLYTGQIQHKLTEECLDAVGSKGGKVNVKLCHGLGGYQTFQFTKNNELKCETKCLYPNSNAQVQSIGCDFSKVQKWTFKPTSENNFGLFVHQESEQCLTYSPDNANNSKQKQKSKSMLKFLSNVVTDLGRNFSAPILSPCDDKDSKQLWSMNLASKWKQ